MAYEIMTLGVFVFIFGLLYTVGGVLSLMIDGVVPSPKNSDQTYTVVWLIFSGIVLMGAGVYWVWSSVGSGGS